MEGPVTSLTNFGCFVDLGDGIEGMIHISDITGEKRLNHPREVLAIGQQVRAEVLEFDRERRAHQAGYEATATHQRGRIHRRAPARRNRYRTDGGDRHAGTPRWSWAKASSPTAAFRTVPRPKLPPLPRPPPRPIFLP